MRAKFGFMVLSLLTFATLMIIVLYLLPKVRWCPPQLHQIYCHPQRHRSSSLRR